MQKSIRQISFNRQLLVLCCLLFSINSWSQIFEAWARRYNDPATQEEKGKAIATDAAGNVYVTGRTEFIVNNLWTSDITTVKYDSRGNQLWVRTYNGPYNRSEDAVDIAVDVFGNVYVTGASESANYDDIITIKYSTNGDQLWASRYDGPQHGNDWASALAIDVNGNVYVTGQRDANEGHAYADLITIKYNSQGVQQWALSYAGASNNSDASNAIVVPGNGFVYVTGKMFETGTQSDAITIKYSIAGSLMWARNFDGPSKDDDFANDLKVDASGNVYIVGSTMNRLTTFWDFLTVKYDANGNQLWYKSIHETNNDIGRKIVLDQNNNPIIAGDGGGGIDKPFNAYYTIKMDPSANIAWTRIFYPDDCASYFGDMTIDKDDNIYVTGSTKRENCQRYYYGTISYYSNGSPRWTKYYTGPGATSRARAIAVDNKRRVYVTGQSLEGAEGSNESGDWSFATVKYSECIVICPSDKTVNNTVDQCDAIVNYGAASTTGECGTLVYSQASGTFFPVGVTTVTVSSPLTGESCAFTVTVKDVQAPKITCPDAVTVSCAADVPPVNVASVTATDNCGVPVVTHVSDVISNKTCANRYTLTRTYKATDASGNSTTCEQVITVNDTTPPQLTGLSLSQYSLWPPNHYMKNITVNYTVVDNCVSNVPVQITITSNEPINGTGDGDTSPDWEVVDAHHIRLRAERAGTGNDRIYTITVTVNDGCNPPVSQSQQVIVAHNVTGAKGNEPVVIIPTEKVEKFEVISYPNPSQHSFTAVIRSNDATKVSLAVYDQQGRLIEKKDVVSVGSIVQFGSGYKPGVYYLQVTQGGKSEQIKLVKL